jgi:3-hydroxyisobutyrate dehydrogenase
MTVAAATPVGFIGLGSMGEPMALNLMKAGTPLLVWNRTPSKCDILAAAGAAVAKDVDEVFSSCEVVILMLLNAGVIDTVLARGDRAFGRRVEGHTLINMGTNPPSYSKGLEAEIRAAGGRFVEAPVSGSRKPAEAGQIVAMLAGEPEVVESVRPLFAPMCRDAIVCGPVPNALSMKLAVNIFMITSVTGLAEAAHFAERQGLDLSKFAAIVNTAQMASDISRVKAAKLLAGDFSKQAAISDCLENNRLIAIAAREAGIAAPLLEVCHALYEETQSLGYGADDMISVIRALEHRTAGLIP